MSKLTFSNKKINKYLMVFIWTLFLVFTGCRDTSKGEIENGLHQKPTKLTSIQGIDLVTFNWEEVADVSKYILYWDTNSSVDKTSTNKIEITSGLSTTINGSFFKTQTDYYFAVTFVDSASNIESDISNVVALKNINILNLHAKLYKTQKAKITWDAIPNATSYKVYWGTEKPTSLQTAPSGTSSGSKSTKNKSIIISSLNINTIYYFTVEIITADSTEMSGFVSVDFAFDSKLSAAIYENKIASLTWDAIPNATYKIYWGTQEPPSPKALPLGTVSFGIATINKFSTPVLDAQTVYYFTIEIITDKFSTMSNFISAKTPSDFIATLAFTKEATKGQYNITWNFDENITPAPKYRLYFATESFGNPASVVDYKSKANSFFVEIEANGSAGGTNPNSYLFSGDENVAYYVALTRIITIQESEFESVASSTELVLTPEDTGCFFGCVEGFPFENCL